jgi:hypothetical protein
MCNPAAAMTMQVAGAASSAVGAYAGAKANKSSLNLQATLADINAKSILDTADINARSIMDTADLNKRQAESAAQQTLLTGEREVQRSQLATAKLKGTQRASLAANGVDLGVGSAEQILTTTDVLGEVDANTLQANAVRGAWGYRTQGQADYNRARTQATGQTTQARTAANNQESQAFMSRASADAISPGSAAFTSLLSSGGAVASSWYQYGKSADTSGRKSFGPELDAFFGGNRGSGD